MDATSSSFAVSSLCAATATCSAAAVGLTWATTRESNRSASPSTLGPDVRPSTTVRHSSSRRSFLARPQSAIVSGSRDNPWALTPGPPAGNRASHQSGTPVESLQETEEAEYQTSDTLRALPQRRASTWFRQRLTLTQSSGQSSQSTEPTSTPSTYTNASNAPFIPSSAPPVSSRNRLVKRSTSQKFPNQPSAESAPFRATFRRPATSHQRSAESGSAFVRHKRSHSSAAPSVRQGRDSSESNNVNNTNPAAWHWEPFFRKHIIRVKAQAEPLLKSPGELFLNKKDELSCVQAPNGQLPTLVMAASVTTQLSIDPQFSPPAQLTASQFQSYQTIGHSSSAPLNRKLSHFHEDFPPPMSTPAEQEPRVTSAFSLSNLIPSPSPATFKIVRRRNSRKHDSPAQSMGGSRHVSDGSILPRGRNQDSLVTNGLDMQATRAGLVGNDDRIPRVRSVSDIGAALQRSRPADSRAVQEQNQNSKLNTPVFQGHRHSFSGGADQANAGLALSASSNSNPRLSRGSRIASDHGSTVHESDTENSRVFSVNGDEYDAFSETNYDSFRTDGTNSSQSAQRLTRIEGVFDDAGRDAYNGDGLSVLEERLSDTSLSGSPRHMVQTANSHGYNRHLSSDEVSGLQRADLEDRFVRSRLLSPPFSPPSPTPQSMYRMSSPTFNTHNIADDFDDSLWDVPEEDLDAAVSSLRLHEDHDDDFAVDDFSPIAGPTYSNADVTPEPQKKVNLWDWSEKQTDDDRPKTVHGKNPIDRSNRTGARRPNVHIRSQSVPTVGDNNKARFNDASKLDTWTLGGKGASEDWDDDFDVDDLVEEPEEMGSSSAGHFKDLRSSGFHVPDTILEKQSSVHYQFNHVKELSQLVEVLRRLRRTADELNIRDGQAAALWVEAEGIIDLATLEEDEELAPPVAARAPSPGLDGFDSDFDERVATPASAHRNTPAVRDETPSRNSPAQHLRGTSAGGHTGSPVTRPRQDSTVQAKIVLEQLASQRLDGVTAQIPIRPAPAQTVPSTPSRQNRPQKQPFDTQSLKNLVVRAGVVTRALQDIVHKAEVQRQVLPGTPKSNHQRSSSGLGAGTVDVNPDPFLSQLFQHPGPLSTPPSQRRSPMFKREGTPMTPSGREVGAFDLTLDTPEKDRRFKQGNMILDAALDASKVASS